ncbi:ABC transporter substrate-binding protein [Paracraurococcus lichenis]|uniref:ABC transporter substrate-binding protein n=1 Tax=Paracraurococcus lichenis TaxID=3064888 RepID=A0ABT9E2W4_9PROT|nr:ABC transporter substrate-binding protein [Paracraurococcus sp. LOR1-02]MDO9710489.1 ABC transporter substrate-binding protein [Paracraurococcus sp. LOR1-02]
MRRMLLAAALLAAAAVAPARAEEKVLRVSLNTELQVLDPIVTTINATRVFAYLVFDTLVGIDSKGAYRPQMLEGWEVSPDRLTWRFRLREGLEFSDGTPVTAADCVASIKRWARRESLGAQLLRAADSLQALDARSFELRLREPFAFVIEALGKPGHTIPVMMPARIAEAPADKAVTEIVGSGPFLFRREEWRPGDRALFHRNPRYRPRAEPADGLAGGKVVKLDRVELVSMPDQATRISALMAGELDFLEIVPFHFIDRLRRSRAITVANQRGVEQMVAILSINHLTPPFNDIRMRRALQAAIGQADVMASLGLPAGMAMEQCLTIYMCDGPLATEAGTEAYRGAGIARARALLQEAGYKGEPVVLLHSESSALLNPTGLVMADQMRQAGFNVDVRTSDYATAAVRRMSKAPVEQGGWNVMPIVWNGIDLVNPLANPAVANNCNEFNSGWHCDEQTTALLRELAVTADPAAQKALAEKLQAAFHRNVNYVLGGQFAAPAAYRSEVTGVVPFAFPVFWNIERR